ncbi:hypothetical protein CSC80_13350 [Maribacter sp. 6B07]|uniref:hypothetical protein n=1 Tax=Maribacter sp. 6B07 TaxID=2045442 RepID=UPI000C07E20E|nr:hypothetical protein [Maribacter sp. 6B07]PHN93090.1 hypothetical protein CSC80_13350 [Maribacter sp. 6B07]
MKYNSPKFKKWLDTLQQESWQLELIISGFAIYGLFAAYEPLKLKAITSNISGVEQFGTIWAIALICCQIFTFNLIIHVLLRGLWIGAIGLRYVSGDINYASLNYSDKFTSYLKKKVGSFDRYIASLEAYCSIIFAASFLMIFYVIGFFTVTISFVLIIQSFELLTFLPKWAIRTIIITFIIPFFLSSIIVFIDFLGQGFLKKKKWTSTLYFPIYWVFSKLTLSFLYRPLAYNFLDNKLGKRLSFILLPIYLIVVIINTLEYKSSNYLNSTNYSSQYQILSEHYDNLSTKETYFINIASIPSKLIETRFLPVFLLHNKEMEDFIYDKNSNLIPKDDNRGFQSSTTNGIKSGFNDAAGIKDSLNLKEYLKTVNEIYKIHIDSNIYLSDFIISSNAKDRMGFETYLNIKNLDEGKHILTITGPTKENKLDSESKTIEKVLVNIPFWYFPENISSSNTQNNRIAADTILTN